MYKNVKISVRTYVINYLHNGRQEKKKRPAVTHHSCKSRLRGQIQPIKEYIRESISNGAQTNTNKTRVLCCIFRTFCLTHGESGHQILSSQGITLEWWGWWRLLLSASVCWCLIVFQDKRQCLPDVCCLITWGEMIFAWGREMVALNDICSGLIGLKENWQCLLYNRYFDGMLGVFWRLLFNCVLSELLFNAIWWCFYLCFLFNRIWGVSWWLVGG